MAAMAPLAASGHRDWADSLRLERSLQRRREEEEVTVSERKWDVRAMQEMLRLDKDPRFVEMKKWLSEQDATAGGKSKPRGEDAQFVDWCDRLLHAISRAITQFDLARDGQDVVAAERQLQAAFDMFQAQRPAWSGRRGAPKAPGAVAVASVQPDSPLEDSALAASSNFPGSAFYVPPGGRPPPPLAAEAAAAADPDGGAGELAAAVPPEEPGVLSDRTAELAPAKDRLQEYHRHMVTPLATKRLRPELGGLNMEKAGTPSTATPGQTARSGLLSARSPTTSAGGGGGSSSRQPGSRPSSATSVRRLQRPATATAVLMRDRAAGSGAVGELQAPSVPASARARQARPASAHPQVVAVPPTTAAEANMEERWLAYRHRELVNITVGEEQRNAVRDWAERRARVEEEIARNAESARFQSGFHHDEPGPEEAAGSTEATTAPGCEPTPPSASSSSSSSSSSGRRRRLRPQSAPNAMGDQREEVARGPDRELTVRFKDPLEGRAAPSRPLSARVAHLRKIHANLIHNMEDLDVDVDDDADDGEASADEAAAEFESLSLYAAAAGGKQASRNADDTDVLAATCDLWSHKQGGKPAVRDGMGSSLHEIRSQQLQEAEVIAQRFVERGVSVDRATIEAALTMPKHELRAGVGELFHEPELMRNPFAKAPAQKKKRRRRAANATGHSPLRWQGPAGLAARRRAASSHATPGRPA